MIGSISIDRVFSLSCFEGLRLLRKHEERQPELSVVELIALVERVEADALSLDLEASALTCRRRWSMGQRWTAACSTKRVLEQCCASVGLHGLNP